MGRVNASCGAFVYWFVHLKQPCVDWLGLIFSWGRDNVNMMIPFSGGEFVILIQVDW